MVRQRGLEQSIRVDSCGTGNWHVGNPPDRRAQQSAESRGYDLLVHRARQVAEDDFQRFDYIFAMDRENLRDLQSLMPSNFANQLELFLPSGSAVPDPYYGGREDFEAVIDLIEAACRTRLDELVDRHAL